MLDINSLNYNQAKILTVYCTVIRPPLSPALNFNYNPARSRYATLVFLRNGYVIDERPLEYTYQAFDFAYDIEAQALYAIEAAYAGILQSFINLAANLNATWITVVDQIAAWNHSTLFWDEVRVVCYADTAIRLVVSSTPYNLSTEQSTKLGDFPPEVPANPTIYPPGTDLSTTDTPVSPPYDGVNDNGNTVPYAGDISTTPTVGCWKVIIAYVAGVIFPSDTVYVIGLVTDAVGLRVNGSQWELFDVITDRLMQSNIVATTSTPAIEEATWYPDCPVEPTGTPP